MLPRLGDFDDAVAVRARRRAQLRERGERDGADRQEPDQQAIAGWHRRRQSGTGAAALRKDTARAPSCRRLRAQRRKTGIDVVAPRMPKTLPPRSIKPLGNRCRSLWVLAQQKGMHVGVGNIGRRAGDQTIRSRPRRSFPQRQPAGRPFRQVQRRRAGRGAFARR